MNNEATYTGHATTAATAGGALAIIAMWVASLFHVDMPVDVGIAFSVILTPLASVAMKQLGVLSA